MAGKLHRLHFSGYKRDSVFDHNPGLRNADQLRKAAELYDWGRGRYARPVSRGMTMPFAAASGQRGSDVSSVSQIDLLNAEAAARPLSSLPPNTDYHKEDGGGGMSLNLQPRGGVESHGNYTDDWAIHVNHGFQRSTIVSIGIRDLSRDCKPESPWIRHSHLDGSAKKLRDISRTVVLPNVIATAAQLNMELSHHDDQVNC